MSIHSSLPPLSIMPFTCSFCPKTFAAQSEQSKHVSACSKKTFCTVNLPSGAIKAYRNSSNQWPCYCNLMKCNKKIYPTANALQQHIRREADENTQWKVTFIFAYIINVYIDLFSYNSHQQVPWNLYLIQ